jgi:hypothetical protein
MSSNLLVMVIDLQGKDIMLLRDLREESFLTFSGFCCWFVFYYLVIYIYIYIILRTSQKHAAFSKINLLHGYEICVR